MKQAILLLNRELQEELYYRDFTDDSGIFHFHSPIELYFVFGGEMEVFVNDKRRVLRAGEMSVALSYDAHSYRTVTHSRSGVLIVPPRLCEEFMIAVRNKKTASPFLSDPEAISIIFDALAKLRECPDNPLKRIGYLYVILGTLLDHLTLEPTAKPVDTHLSSRLLFYINEHYREDINLTALATALGYSREYISRYFKSSFHIGLSRYISFIRLRAAVALMQERKHSITYCAMESGFNSMRTFYRAFFEEFHCSPREYLGEELPPQ